MIAIGLSAFSVVGGPRLPYKRNYLTREGLNRLEAELEDLRTDRRQSVAEQIQKAKELGGSVDNAEYEDSKNQQAFVEGRILTLEKMINKAVLIEENEKPTKNVEIGRHVTLINQTGKKEEYTIVGSVEADPGRGRISNESPVGMALLNKKVGQKVQVKTPAGLVTLTISSIG